MLVRPVFLFTMAVCFFVVVACNQRTETRALDPVIIDNGPECSSIPECLQILTSHGLDGDHTHSGISVDSIGNATDTLRKIGPAALDDLIELLDHPNYKVRKRIGYSIHQIGPIDPKYSSVLIQAHKKGVPWLAKPIGNTETEAALDYLWIQFLYDPDEGSNGSTMYALAGFGERAFVKILPAIEKCSYDIDVAVCMGLVELAGIFAVFPDLAVPVFEEMSTQHSLDDYQKHKIEVALDRHRVSNDR